MSKKGLVLPTAVTAEGSFRGLLVEEDGVVPAEFRPIEEGKPLYGDYVLLSGKKGDKVLLSERHSLDHDGPAKVATEAYREGWDRIFGQNTIGEA